MSRLLLAYDGSPKADEALFVATYLASRWPIALTVLTVETDFTSAEDLRSAQQYLEQHGVETAEYVLRQKPTGKAILETAASRETTMIIMGGFGFRPVLKLVLGSTVDTVLRGVRQPLLICR
jgi:nucleotide-binding universal stress UspA family protein